MRGCLLSTVILFVTLSYVMRIVFDRKAPIASFDSFQLSCVIFRVYFVVTKARWSTSFETGVSFNINWIMSSAQSRQSSKLKSLQILLS